MFKVNVAFQYSLEIQKLINRIHFQWIVLLCLVSICFGAVESMPSLDLNQSDSDLAVAESASPQFGFRRGN